MNKNLNHSLTFEEGHSLALRIWHWITAITITASIVLVLFGSTMFRTRNNIEMVREQLQRKGIEVTNDQARAVAHEYSDKLWMAHKWVGYGLCFLLLSRIIIEIARVKDDRLVRKIKNALGFMPKSSPEHQDRRHYLSVKSGYLIFYIIFFLMGITGLGLAFEDAEFLKPFHEAIKEVHEFLQYAIYAYILIHLIGVIMADTGKYQGIVSRMIHGRKVS